MSFIHFYRASLDARFCYSNYVRLSVRLSVCHTGHQRLNGSLYRNILCSGVCTRQSAEVPGGLLRRCLRHRRS